MQIKAWSRGAGIANFDAGYKDAARRFGFKIVAYHKGWLLSKMMVVGDPCDVKRFMGAMRSLDA